MSADVHEYADQLRQYATHFAPEDWDYDRELGDLRIYRTDPNRLRRRLANAWRALTRRHRDWEREMFPDLLTFRWRLHSVRRALGRQLLSPDGVVNGGFVITFWEETGEYLHYVQPSVGALLADLMDDVPEHPVVQAIADEMKRINDRYGERVGAEEATS